jgi:hypothetical protein
MKIHLHTWDEKYSYKEYNITSKISTFLQILEIMNVLKPNLAQRQSQLKVHNIQQLHHIHMAIKSGYCNKGLQEE